MADDTDGDVNNDVNNIGVNRTDDNNTTDASERTELPRNLKLVFSRISRQLETYYNAPYRRAIAKAQRDEEDLFLLLVYGEALGIPNPAAFYTLELQPLLLERFHQWHQRMGMERSPLDEFRCC